MLLFRRSRCIRQQPHPMNQLMTTPHWKMQRRGAEGGGGWKSRWFLLLLLSCQWRGAGGWGRGRGHNRKISQRTFMQMKFKLRYRRIQTSSIVMISKTNENHGKFHVSVTLTTSSTKFQFQKLEIDSKIKIRTVAPSVARAIDGQWQMSVCLLQRMMNVYEIYDFFNQFHGGSWCAILSKQHAIRYRRR